MRIAVITETYPPEVNGVALTVYGLVARMAADGHELLLVRPRQPGVSALPLPQPIDELLVAGAGLPKYPGLRFGFPAGALLHRRFSARRPDAVYVATEGPLGWSAVRAARRLGIPVATGFHTRFDAYAGAYGFRLLEPIVRHWLRRMHNASGATVVPTEELREWLEQRGFRRVRVVARAVDAARREVAHALGSNREWTRRHSCGPRRSREKSRAGDRSIPQHPDALPRGTLCLGRWQPAGRAPAPRASGFRIHGPAARRGSRCAFRIRRHVSLPEPDRDFWQRHA